MVSTRFRHQVRGDDVALVGINTHSVAVLTNTTSFGCLPNVPGALICSPAANSTNTAQVKLTAGAVPNSGHITALRFYINTKELQTLQNTTGAPVLQGSVMHTFAPGKYQLSVVGYQSTGGFVKKTIFFTVH